MNKKSVLLSLIAETYPSDKDEHVLTLEKCFFKFSKYSKNLFELGLGSHQTVIGIFSLNTDLNEAKDLEIISIDGELTVEFVK
jgi:hypothetical protein